MQRLLLLWAVMTMMFKRNKVGSLAHKLDLANGKIKPNFIKREFGKAKEILDYQNKGESYGNVVLASIVLAGLGVIVGLVAQNPVLSIILGIGCCLIPVWLTVSSLHRYKLFVADELESGLAIISTTYLRQNSFVNAVEENICYLNSPLKEVMQEFVNQVRGVNPNVAIALENIKPKIKNAIWYEWINEVVKCQANHTLKANLMNIVTKLSDVKIVQSDLDTMLKRDVRDYKTLLILSFSALPGVYMINHEWFSYFFTRLPGKIALALAAVLILVSVAKMIAASKPVEYKR